MIGVIVFVKNPELGKVKTRLAESVGDQEALDIYLQLMNHTRQVMTYVEEITRYTFYSSFIDPNDEWSNDLFVKKLQSTGDLGNKIQNAFTDIFTQCSKVIIIGSDCAQLRPMHISEAIEQLEHNNVVIGPTYDGGYYLLGMDSNYSFLFDDIKWSTESVMQDTLDIARQNELTSTKLETLSDVDFIEDWNEYGKPFLQYISNKQQLPFSNNQVSLEEIPRVATLEYSPLENNLLKADQIYNTIFFGVGFVILAFLRYVIEVEAIISKGHYIAIFLAGMLLLTLVFTYFQFYKKSYAIRERDIIFNKGLFWKSSTVIPFNRVQHCEVSQGPLDRYFKLSELKVFTAGGASSDLKIEGLSPDTAKRIKDFIVAKTGIDEEE